MNTRSILLPVVFLLMGGVAFAQSSSVMQPPDSRAPQELSSMITPEGHVLLYWNAPLLDLEKLDQYEVWRCAMVSGAQFEKIATTNLALEYTDLSAQPGDKYDYYVAAVYEDNSVYRAYTSITYPTSSPTFKIVSTPPPTAKVGEAWEYSIEFELDPSLSTVQISLEGAPDSLEARPTVPNPALLWDSPKVGVYDFTLIATAKDQNNRTFQTYQCIRLVVSEKTGTVVGSVTSKEHNPIPYSFIQLTLFPENGADTKISVQADEFGVFAVPNIPVGKVIAYCYPGNDNYLPRYYNTVQTTTKLEEATIKQLAENVTLTLDFVLLDNGNTEVAVGGQVYDESNTIIDNAQVHFLKKSNFIIIGDKSSVESPNVIENWSNTKIDTTVISDNNGMFVAYLPPNTEYYIVVEKNGFYETFSPNMNYCTNALEAYPFNTGTSGRAFNYRIVEKDTATSSVQGVVRRDDNGVNRNATILMIDSQLKQKRGTGGGATYSYGRVRSVLTDSNGVYEFKNVPRGEYIILAIPMDRDVVPQYYHSSVQNDITFEYSGIVNVYNTIQGVNFSLSKSQNDGSGQFWGNISVRENNQTPYRVSGSLVYAVNPITQQIVAYAISDSLGWYSLPNLRPGTYQILADHPRYGWTKVQALNIDYTTITDPNRVLRQDIVINITSTTSVDADSYDPNAIPQSVSLDQNYPNPFNPSTTIRFGLNRTMNVRLSVYNALGQEIRVLSEGEKAPGTYSIAFDASELPSGLYFYRLTTRNGSIMKSMTLTK